MNLRQASLEMPTTSLTATSLTVGSVTRLDTSPSILQRSITSVTEESRIAKRAKLSIPPEKTTIASQIQSSVYTTIEQLIADVDTAVSEFCSEVNVRNDINKSSRNAIYSYEDRAQVFKALALKKELGSIVLREMIQRPHILNTEALDSHSYLGGHEIKGLGLSTGSDGMSRTVLTMYGSAPGPKHLFSSLQVTTRIDANSIDVQGKGQPFANIADELDSTTMPAPLMESTLPPGISVTKVVPVHSGESMPDKQHMPTIGDVFAPPLTQVPLNPPRQSRHTATRSSSVNWFNPSETVPPIRTNRREYYISQPLSTGQWLTYNIAPSPTQLSSPEAKRKQRDRALSFGESRTTISQEDVVAHQQAKEDAAFRSAYSTFGPDRDNAAALVPENVKNRLWWKRFGETKYHDLLSSAPSIDLEEDVVEVDDLLQDSGLGEDDTFREAVESWVPEEVPSDFREVADVKDEAQETSKDVDEILRDISGLLETLNSYQRVRNLSLATNSRTTAGQNPQLTAMSGSPTSPSSPEFDIYSILKSQLTLMIASLPPYAVAKLDGEKLEALNVGSRIQVDGKQYKGTIEEDEFTARTKQVALNAATGSTARGGATNPSVSARGAHYQPPAIPIVQTPRSNYAAQPSAPRPPSSALYAAQQQYSGRPATSSNYYSSTGYRPSYPPQRPSTSTSERYTYAASQHPIQQSGQTHQGQYVNGYRSYPASNSQSFSQYTSPIASTQGSQYQRPSQPGYQQRAQNTQHSYASETTARSASPQNAGISYTPQHQPRYPYHTQGSTPSQSRPQPSHQASQYAVQTPSSTQVNGAGSQHTFLTANEQALLMNRQKAQLAEQVQTSSVRQGSGTPQPANGLFGGQSSGASVPQANGVMVGQGQ